MTAGRSLKVFGYSVGQNWKEKKKPQFLYLTYSVPVCKEGEREARKASMCRFSCEICRQNCEENLFMGDRFFQHQGQAILTPACNFLRDFILFYFFLVIQDRVSL